MEYLFSAARVAWHLERFARGRLDPIRVPADFGKVLGDATFPLLLFPETYAVAAAVERGFPGLPSNVTTLQRRAAAVAGRLREWFPDDRELRLDELAAEVMRVERFPRNPLREVVLASASPRILSDLLPILLGARLLSDSGHWSDLVLDQRMFGWDIVHGTALPQLNPGLVSSGHAPVDWGQAWPTWDGVMEWWRGYEPSMRGAEEVAAREGGGRPLVGVSRYEVDSERRLVRGHLRYSHPPLEYRVDTEIAYRTDGGREHRGVVLYRDERRRTLIPSRWKGIDYGTVPATVGESGQGSIRHLYFPGAVWELSGELGEGLTYQEIAADMAAGHWGKPPQYLARPYNIRYGGRNTAGLPLEWSMSSGGHSGFSIDSISVNEATISAVEAYLRDLRESAFAPRTRGPAS